MTEGDAHRPLELLGKAQGLPYPVLVVKGDRARRQAERVRREHEVLRHPPEVEEPAALDRSHEHLALGDDRLECVH